MTDPSTLLASLAIALVAAALSGAVAAALRQSVIVGYIVAGMIVGPYTPGYVADGGSVEGLAGIGVILLLFVTGMGVSIRDFASNGPVAVAGSLLQVAVLTGAGYLVGTGIGWEPGPAFVLGAIASNSSSTVISKVLGERGDSGLAYARLSLAWSSIQDLTTIVLVLLITAMAVESDSIVADTAIELAKAAAFLIVLVPVGARILPWAFARIRAVGSREVFLLSAASLGLGAAYVASTFGLSPALGAFVAGVVLGESDIRHEIVDGLGPIRDVFVGLFFVSIGMLVDPLFVLRQADLVLVVLGLIVLVKGAVTAGITSLFRVPLRTGLMVAAALAQSAEFSFLLASVAATLGVVTNDEFSALVAGAAASVVLAPMLLAGANEAVVRLERSSRGDLRRLPEGVPSTVLRDHIVLCGHGRVGSVVRAVLATQNDATVVIDDDPNTVHLLRDQGVVALMGRADNPLVLEQAGLQHAGVLVIAVPDEAVVRRLVRVAREMNPRLVIVARTHSADERDFLESHGVDEAVLAELELALEMTRYTLRARRVDTMAIEDRLEDARFTADEVARHEAGQP